MPSLGDQHLLARGEALAHTYSAWAARLEAKERTLWAGLYVGQRFEAQGGYTVIGITPTGAVVRFTDGTEQAVTNPYS